MAAFKYAKRVHAKQLLTMGILRVGTLHDFRRMEHAKGIADPQEGKKRVSHLVKDLKLTSTGVTTASAMDEAAFAAYELEKKFKIQGGGSIMIS
ncbi:MAG: hypothetical protein WAU52_05580, partial [Burkholderiales bacterium]